MSVIGSSWTITFHGGARDADVSVSSITPGWPDADGRCIAARLTRREPAQNPLALRTREARAGAHLVQDVVPIRGGVVLARVRHVAKAAARLVEAPVAVGAVEPGRRAGGHECGGRDGGRRVNREADAAHGLEVGRELDCEEVPLLAQVALRAGAGHAVLDLDRGLRGGPVGDAEAPRALVVELAGAVDAVVQVHVVAAHHEPEARVLLRERKRADPRV